MEFGVSAVSFSAGYFLICMFGSGPRLGGFRIATFSKLSRCIIVAHKLSKVKTWMQLLNGVYRKFFMARAR